MILRGNHYFKKPENDMVKWLADAGCQPKMRTFEMISTYRNNIINREDDNKPNLKQHYLLLHDASDRIGAGFVTVFESEIRSDNAVRELLFHNWPPGVPEYSAPVLGVIRNDIMASVRQTMVPFYYKLTERLSPLLDNQDKDVIETVLDMGMFEGWVFPAHGPKGEAGFVMLGKIDETLSRQDMALMHGICLNLFESYFEHKPKIASNDISLDGSELKILQLLQSGHTMNEISNKTGLSVPTVNVYCEKLIRTLGAKTLTHAVVIAMGKKLI